MINLALELQTATFTALQAVKTDPNVVAALNGQELQVFAHIPENSAPPFVQTGRITSTPDNTQYDGQLESMTMEVFACWRGMGKTPLLTILHAIREALAPGLATDKAIFLQVIMTKLEDDLPVADGQTYFGLIEFECWAQPAA